MFNLCGCRCLQTYGLYPQLADTTPFFLTTKVRQLDIHMMAGLATSTRTHSQRSSPLEWMCAASCPCHCRQPDSAPLAVTASSACLPAHPTPPGCCKRPTTLRQAHLTASTMTAPPLHRVCLPAWRRSHPPPPGCSRLLPKCRSLTASPTTRTHPRVPCSSQPRRTMPTPSSLGQRTARTGASTTRVGTHVPTH